jgi:hypothetical protein
VSFTSDSLSFDAASFKKAHASLYVDYVTTETEEKIKESFEIFGEKNAALAKWNKPLNEEKKNISKEKFVRGQVNRELKRNSSFEKIHAEHLAFSKEITLLQWDLELIKYQLKASVDKDETIDGVCSWKRELSTTTKSKFDEETFKKEQPAYYLKYYVLKPGNHKVIIHPHRAYPA